MEGSLWILDRIEDGEQAVLLSENGDERAVPRSELPSDAREGDALREGKGEGRVGYVLDRGRSGT